MHLKPSCFVALDYTLDHVFQYTHEKQSAHKHFSFHTETLLSVSPIMHKKIFFLTSTFYSLKCELPPLEWRKS